MITCSRCEAKVEPMAQAPMPGELGETIKKAVCSSCWQEWLRYQVMIINEYRLSLQDPQTRTLLIQHLRDFLKLPQ
ncbi:MAG: Fe(2+)-trafficking protein [Thermoanaerobaculaceae bacterium]